MPKLPRIFYDRDTILVAQELLGKWLVHQADGGERIGKIVEVEAYLGEHDLAAHSSKGRTERTKIMFGPPGHAYVYLIYGMWHCLNVVSGEEGVPHAVLLRALAPVSGVTGRASGPGLLCRALGIDRGANGLDLTGATLWIERPHAPQPVRIGRSARIGIDYAGEWAARPWRFFDRDSPEVSGRRARPKP